MPEITVILPVYNGGKYLTESVLSVLSQTLRDFEFLILDDCSTDGSWAFLNSLNDNRIVLYQNKTNKGLFYNLNFLCAKSTSPLIKLWAQDDRMKPTALEDIVAFHKQYPQVGFSYTMVEYMDDNSKSIPKFKVDTTPAVIDRDLHARIAFQTGSIAANIGNVTIAKTALETVGPFNEEMRMSGDFDMWVRIAEFYDIGFLRKPLIVLRDHNNQLSRQEKYYMNALREDIIVYKRLLGYIPNDVKLSGKKILRENKLVFYYTLMLHFLLKGKISTTWAFWKGINELDNGFVMFYYFLKKKMRPLYTKLFFKSNNGIY